MGWTKVSWEVFKTTDEFSCTSSEEYKWTLLTFFFFNFKILLLNMASRGKTTWNNFRLLRKTCCHYLICQSYNNFPQTNSITENVNKHCQLEERIALPCTSSFYFITFISKLSLSGDQGLGICPKQAILLFIFFLFWPGKTFTPTYTPCSICFSKAVLENDKFIKN